MNARLLTTFAAALVVVHALACKQNAKDGETSTSSKATSTSSETENPVETPPIARIDEVHYTDIPTVTTGVPFSVTITLKDANGTPVTEEVSLSVRALDPANGSPNDLLSGPTTSTTTSGLMTFSGLVYTGENDFVLEIYSEEGLFAPTSSTRSAQKSPLSRSWIEPAGISDFISIAGSQASYPAVGIADNGQRAVSWAQIDGNGKARLLVSEFTGNSWTHPSQIDTEAKSPDAASLMHHRMDMNKQGDILIVFTALEGAMARLYFAERVGGTWSFPMQITDAISATGPSAGTVVTSPAYIDLAENGDAVITWSQEFEGYDHVYMSRKIGGIWHHPDTPLLGDPDNQRDYSPQAVGISSDGSVHLVWNHFKIFDTPQAKQYLYTYSLASSSLLDYHQLSHDNAMSGAANIRFNNAGEGLVTFDQHHDGLSKKVAYRGEYSGGFWSLPGKNDYYSPQARECDAAAIAISDDGDITTAQACFDIYALFLSERIGGIWHDPADENDYFFQSSGINTPAIARSSSSVNMIWNAGQGSYQTVFTASRSSSTWIFPASSSDGIAPTSTDAEAGSTGSSHSVASDSYGNIIQAWEQDSKPGGTGEMQIYLREYR